jgi:hypothetical protein
MCTYDVFVSYTRRRDAAEARALAAFLTEAGYSVWFDERSLNRKTSWRMESKEALIQVIGDAVRASRCVILFAIEQAVIPIPFDSQRAEKSYQVIADESGKLIAWSWQIFEMRQAARTLVLYQSDDRQPEAVIDRLVRMDIYPTQRKRVRRRLLERAWMAIHRRLNRKRRVKTLMSPLPRPDSTTKLYQYYLYKLDWWMTGDLNTPKTERYSALIGEAGTGRSTLIDRVARSPLWSQWGREMLQVRLPALDDVDAWTELAMKEPADTIFVFDDLSVQLEAYAPSAQKLLWTKIEQITRWRHDSLFVFSPEHADEILLQRTRRGGTSRCRLISGELREYLISDHSKPEDIESLVRWQWNEYAETGQINFQTEHWNDYRFVSVLNRIPVYSDLRPVNYETLEGLQLSEPTKSLTVLKEVVEKAKASAQGQVPCVSDRMFDEVIGRITGLPVGHGKDHFDSLVSGITEGEHFTQMDKQGPYDWFEQLVLRMNLPWFPYSDRPGYALCIADHEKRRRFARRLAEQLLGSKEAVLILDYDVILDQILDATQPYTDTFRWMLRSVERFPWRIIIFESLHKAPDIDQRGVRTIFQSGEVAFGARRAPFDRCVLLFDNLDCLEKEKREVVVIS